MATYRYCDIRRDMYEQCSNKTPNKFRTLADMRKLFKTSYWVLLGGTVGCLVAYIAMLIFRSSTIYCLIPICIEYLLFIISEFLGYRMYNPMERKKEIDNFSNDLEKYIEGIQNTLRTHGITTKSQRDMLKKECEHQLSICNERHKSVRRTVFDMLVGVPLGAFISALIYQSEGADIVLSSLFDIVVLGLMIIGLSGFFQRITYYSDGYFKDQYLLSVLNELEYLPE